MRPTLDDLPELRPRRVCIIKPSALGDVVHALPMLSALRAHWPEATIVWVINRPFRELLDGHPYLDEVIVADRVASLGARARFLTGLRARRFDVTIDLQGLFRSAVMTAATGAPVRVGMSDAREGALLTYTHRVAATRRTSHAVDRYLQAAALFGANIDAPRFVVAMSDEDRLWARAALDDAPAPRLLLNLGARWVTKRWPPEHFAAVARRAVETCGASVVAVGAPEDRPLVEALRTHLDPIPVLDLCGRTTLPRLAALAGESDVFLSNDSGPLHLAAAAGARVVGVHTCTSPRLTGAYGPLALAVQSCVWCAPSFLKRCRRLDCMAELTPDRVWPAVRGQLDARREDCPQMTQIYTDKKL